MKESLSDGTIQKTQQGKITIERNIFTMLLDKICFLCNKEEGTNKYKYYEDVDTVTDNSGGQNAINFLIDFIYRYPYVTQRSGNEEIKKRKSELALQARVLRLEELMDKLLKEINVDEDSDGRNINQR